MNLKSFDLVAGAEILRDWTGALIDLEADPSAAESRRQLAQTSRRLLELRPYLERPRRSIVGRHELNRRARQVITLQKKVKLRNEVALALARYLEPRPWRRWLRPGFPARSRRPRFHPSLWPVVAAISWTSASWHRRVVCGVHHHLKRHILLPAAPLPQPSIQLETYWFLVELAAPPLVPGRWWRRRRGRWVRKRLARVAGRQLGPGRFRGFGFWDQWLLAETALRHRGVVEQGSRHARQRLAGLPWLAEPRYQEVVKLLPRNRPALFDPGWEVPAELAGWGDIPEEATADSDKIPPASAEIPPVAAPTR